MNYSFGDKSNGRPQTLPAVGSDPISNITVTKRVASDASGNTIVMAGHNPMNPAAGPEPRVVRETMPDDSITPYSLYCPDDMTSDPQARFGSARGIVVLWPGFGMGARYYRPMALELARRGFCVLVSELRGQGLQNAVASRRNNWGYHHLASEDYPIAVSVARREFGADLPVYLMCHSMGGQIASLYASRPEADVAGIITVGSGTPYRINFTGKQRGRLTWGAPVMQAVSKLFGYWPAGQLDLAGYGRQSAMHVREWAGFSRTGRWQLHVSDQDYVAAMEKTTIPILMLTCDGDRDCPPESVKDLARRLPRTARYEFLNTRLGHNRWAREPKAVAHRFERFTDEIANWHE